MGGSAINFAGLLIGTASQFALVLALTQLLSKRNAGVFLIGFAIFRLAVILFGLGTNMTAVRYVALGRGRGDSDFADRASRSTIALSLVGGSIGAVTITSLSSLLADAFHAPQLKTVIVVLAVGIPFSTFTLAAAGAIRGSRRTSAAIFLDQIADNGFRFLGLLIGVVWAGSVTGAAVGFTLGGIFAGGTACLLLPRRQLFGERLGKSDMKEMLRFTGFQWGTAVVGGAFRWTDSLLLGLWTSPSQVAVYSTATRTVWLGLVFVMPIVTAFQPLIAERSEARDWTELRSLYRSAARLATTVGSSPLVLTAVCAAPLLATLYGESYRSGAAALAFLAVGQAVNAATGPAATVATMLGHSDVTLVINIVALVANVALNIILIPAFGMTGAGVAWCLSLVLLSALRFAQCRREIGVHVLDGWLVRALVAIAVGAGTSSAIVHFWQSAPEAGLVVVGFVSGMVVIPATMVLLGLRPGDMLPARVHPSGALSR